MAAVIQALFPAGTAEAPARRGAATPAADAGRPALVESLREKTLVVFSHALRQLFDHADDLLFELGEKADSDAERRRNFDTMRVLRLGREGVTQAFIGGYRRGFAAREAEPLPEATGVMQAAHLASQATEAREEKIAIGNLAAKAERQHRNTLYELGLRLKAAAADHGAELSPDCLDPQRICAAFGAAIGGIETDFPIKLVVYKLLERVVIQAFGRAYEVAQSILEEHGIGLPRRPEAIVPSRTRPDLPLRIRRPSDEPSLNAAAQQILNKYGLGTAADPVATALSRLIQQRSTRGGWEGLQAATQRLSMAGRLIDELLAEPLLLESRRRSIEALRHPVYRSALTDPGFFTDGTHPLRRLLSDFLAASLAEPAPAALPEDLGTRLHRAVEGLAGGLDREEAPDPATLRPIAPGEVQVFLRQLREDARQRRELALSRVRAQVTQALDARTRNRRLPAPVIHLLQVGVGPLMALRLLRSGRDSVPFHQAEETLEELFTSLEFLPPASPQVLQSREALMSTLVTALSDIGMKAERVESLLEGLREVYARREQGAPAPRPDVGIETPALGASPGADADPASADAPASGPVVAAETAGEFESLPSVTVMELLSRVLRVESWYRVFDAERDQTRWLKLQSFYPQQDSIVFSGFDESMRLTLHASRFATDLAFGHSEPINPDPSARQSLDQLRGAKQRGVF